MKKPSVIIDTALTLAALFFLGCIVMGYFTRNTGSILCAAAVFSLTVTFFTGRLTEKRHMPQKKKRKLDDLMNKFVFSPHDYAYRFTLDALTDKCAVKEENGLILAGGTAFCVRLTGEKVSTAVLAERYAAATQLRAKRLVILSAYGAEQDALETAKLLSAPTAEIWDFCKVYAFFVYLKHPPTETLRLKPTRKKKFGAVFSIALRRENARRYLFSAIVTLLFARFLPYSVFYVVIAAISLVLAILCRLRIAERLSSKHSA